MLSIHKLRCEYKENPIGIGVLRPRLSWRLESDERNIMQGSYRIQVSEGCKDFQNIVWDTGRINSDESVHIEYGGQPLQSRARYYYRVQAWDTNGNSTGWSETAFWEMGLLCKCEWTAQWITAEPVKDTSGNEPCPLFRKGFEVRGKVSSARIYATSLGLYELHLNGSRVGDWYFTPGWTSYKKRLQYQAYDVTDKLNSGTNVIGAVLGEGWYKGNLAWSGNKNIYGDKAALLLQAHIVYEDGKEEILISDASWRTSTGAILKSEIYDGEIFDARQDKEGWSTPAYDDRNWPSAVELEHTKDILVAQENVPVRVIEQIKPVKIFKTPAGDTVVDMGQNMVGWVRVAAEGQAGTEITIQHAEVLDKDGNFYSDNLRSAKQTNVYILKGSGRETFEPHFTFQGFRYVKVDGYPGTLSLDSLTGMVVHSDMEPIGSFKCSNELVNQLQHNIRWGQKGNFLDVPTDCPQRDERLGWTGDAQMFIRTACFNMNVAPFFTKWLRDVKADQLKNGGIPFVVPHVLDDKAYSSAAWGDAAVICPWTIYLCFGDKRILEEQYDSMKAWVEYMHSQGENEYLWNTGFHFGDWLGLDAKEDSYVGATARDYIATAYYAYSTNILRQTAELLGRDEDARIYRDLYVNIIDALRREFITPGGRIAVPTQTAHVLALMFDLVEEKDRKRTIDTLAEYLNENNDHLTTGFVGTPYLCHVLSGNGRKDLAYKLLMQTDYPSWLYQVTKGATTIWEHWDGIKVDGSFWSRDMNSFNHYAYGSIGDWLYRVVAGIDTDSQKPGYKHIHIQPQPGQELDFAEASLESMYGTVISSWERKGNVMQAGVVIPPNTSATVVLPYAVVETLSESGKKIGEADGINGFEQVENGVRLELGSGKYSFSYNIG